MNKIDSIKDIRKNKLLIDISKAVNGADDIDADKFAHFIYELISNGYITENIIRDEFGLTSGAVDRWILKNNLPQIDVRKIILKWIFDKIC